MIITIDGPAGSGKSTVARKIAKKLGIIHLNSGALFRAIGLKAKRTGVELDDEGAVARLAAATEFEFVLSPIDEKVGSRDTCLLVDGKDIDEQLGSAEASMLASRIAVQSKLRDVLLRVQRELSLKHSLVVEGRDAGTVVFPNAEFKFYLDADIRVRAERRFAEQQDALDVDAVQAELEARDHRDATREIAPQVAADDATVIDTSELGIDEVVEELCGRIKVASL